MIRISDLKNNVEVKPIDFDIAELGNAAGDAPINRLIAKAAEYVGTVANDRIPQHAFPSRGNDTLWRCENVT